MKFSELKKGETYYRFERLFVGDSEVFKLIRKRITVLTPKTIEMCTVTPRGALASRSRMRVYNPETFSVGIYATPADAKFALVNIIRTQIKSAEEKVRRLTAELNEALLIPTSEEIAP